MFAHFLHHPGDREGYVRKGMKRVYENYTLCHVLGRLTDFLGIKVNSTKDRATSPSGTESVTR